MILRKRSFYQPENEGNGNENKKIEKEVDTVEWESVSGTLIVADPCFVSPDHRVSDCRLGKWYTDVEKIGVQWSGTEKIDRRISKIVCYHEDYKDEKSREILECHKGTDATVDSGDVIVLDQDCYPEDDSNEQLFDPFFNYCGKQTLSKKRYGVIYGKGIATSSGYGDGCYDVDLYTDDGDEVGMIVVTLIDERDLGMSDEEIERESIRDMLNFLKR